MTDNKVYAKTKKILECLPIHATSIPTIYVSQQENICVSVFFIIMF